MKTPPAQAPPPPPLPPEEQNQTAQQQPAPKKKSPGFEVAGLAAALALAGLAVRERRRPR